MKTSEAEREKTSENYIFQEEFKTGAALGKWQEKLSFYHF